jgi:2-succinyl-5-enolpyruvyl-6-hydroxy-3-cyclohexene-1-carboxylate synthase
METLQKPSFLERKKALVDAHRQRLVDIAERCKLGDDQPLDASNIGYLLKHTLPEKTVFVVEAVTCAQLLSDQLQADRPGSWINCGATGIGWSNGAALGVKMAEDDTGLTMEGSHEPALICQVVGDGSFMCAAPSSALWVASKYKIPILTVVLNNGGKSVVYSFATRELIISSGFKAPKNSTALVYPNGLNEGATDDEMNISFKPSPNYAALAEAAAGNQGSKDLTQDSTDWMIGVQVDSVASLRRELGKASQRVLEARKGMLIEALIA